MTSKTSWFNKEMAIQIFRSTGWIGVVYLIGLFFALPLRILMLYTSEQELSPTNLVNLFSLLIEVQFLLFVVIPVLLSVFLFRFIQVKQSADLIHSLPIKRTTVFHQYSLMGCALLILPVMFNSLVMILLASIIDLEVYYSIQDVFYWAGVTVLIGLLFFFATVFIGMLTGISVLQGILTYIMLLFPAGILVLIYYHLEYFLAGFSAQYSLRANFEAASPITNLVNLENGISAVHSIVYCILIIGLYVGALFLYKYRKVEKVSEAFVFISVKPVFKYGVAFCFTLLGGLYFGQTQGDSFIWQIFGYIAGSIFGYFIAEMVLQKTWRVLRSIKGYFLFAGVMVVLFLLLEIDITGYEKKIPDTDEIARVYFSNNTYEYGFEESEIPKKYFTEQKNIDAIRELHKELIDKNHSSRNLNYEDQAFFAYELKNGDKLIRGYSLPDVKQFAAFYKPIVESEEYKKLNNEILSISEENVDKMTITSQGPYQKSTSFSDEKELKKAIKLLKEDIYQETYENSNRHWGFHTDIEILLSNDKRLNLPYKHSYRLFTEWFMETGKYEEAVVTANDISSAYVINKSVIQFDENNFSHEEVGKLISESSDTLQITESKELVEALDNFEWGVEGEYLVAFYFKENDNLELGSFDEDTLPGFVKEKLNRNE
ncbi:polysaccharide biosynthesis protein [Metabacillus arenae]|uniref:Multidrug ABC transporter permease n=1 Tax=Metabacillus arenae TaxID=2771434 RepID=A0A926RXT0_9BACI|nr:multidrug ABC transporter permease [Metabacillus arenae]MBD1381301.1 multidrug ABC transporter permease [Metabacillus arenae]